MSERALPKGGDTQDELRRRASAVLAGGVSSNVRMLNPPVIVDRAAGCRLFDVAGNDYIDYLLGQGPNFLGHAPRGVVDKIVAAQRDGVIYAATHRREIEAAERLVAVLAWPETVRFASSSSELVQAAMRMARHATGRQKILRFHGHYHGWFDNINTRLEDGQALTVGGGQLPQALAELVIIDWNDIAAFEQAISEDGDALAAVIMEPIMLNAGAIEPEPGYLEAVRRLCAARGIALIFDETITGFRIAVGGAVERYGVVPDLAIYGKAIAAGWPCAALVGRRSLFTAMARGEVVHGGTFNGNVISAAAVLACLDEIADGEVHRRVERAGTTLKSSLVELFSAYDLGIVVQGLPMAFHARFASDRVTATRYDEILAADTNRYRQLAHALVGHGVWVAARGIWYVSSAHRDRDLDETLDRVSSTLRDLY